MNRSTTKRLLSPRALARAIGVSESSVKRWVDSGLLQAARTAGGHRRIEFTEAVRFIRASGWPVLDPAAIALGTNLPSTMTLPRPGAGPAQTFHDALVGGDAETAETLLLNEYLRGAPATALLDEIMAPALARIGHLWQTTDRSGLFIEHRASDICTGILHRIRQLQSDEVSSHIAVGASAADDWHALPSLMAATTLTLEGWQTHNLGALTPPAVLAEAAVECAASLVWLAVTTPIEPDRAGDTIAETAEALQSAGSDALLVVGGPAIDKAVTAAVSTTGITCADSMQELVRIATARRRVASA